MYTHITLECTDEPSGNDNKKKLSFLKNDLNVLPIGNKLDHFEEEFFKSASVLLDKYDSLYYINNGLGIAYEEWDKDTVKSIYNLFFDTIAKVYSLKYVLTFDNGGGDYTTLFCVNDNTLLNMALDLDHELCELSLYTMYTMEKKRDAIPYTLNDSEYGLNSYTINIPKTDVDITKKYTVKKDHESDNNIQILTSIPSNAIVPTILNGGKEIIHFKSFFKAKVKEGLKITINSNIKSLFTGKFTVDVSKLSTSDIDTLITDALKYGINKLIDNPYNERLRTSIKRGTKFAIITSSELENDHDIVDHILMFNNLLFKFIIAYDKSSKMIGIKHLVSNNTKLAVEHTMESESKMNIAYNNEKLLTPLRDLKLTAGYLAVEDDGMISKFASFFTNKINAFTALFSKNSNRISEKDYSQFVKELLKLKKDIEPLISKIKYSDVETMVIPVILGLRADLLNASTILTEVISKTEPMLVTALDNVDSSISKILSDTHFRTASRYPNMKHLDELQNTNKILNKALSDLIDGNSVTDTQKIAFLLPNINSLTTIYNNLERVANITTLKNIKTIEDKINKVGERATYLYELLTDKNKKLELSKSTINGISDELEYSAVMVTTMISLIHVYNQVVVTATAIVDKFKKI